MDGQPRGLPQVAYQSENLAGLPQQRHSALYTQVGGKILYRASDIEKTLMKGYKEAYRLNE